MVRPSENGTRDSTCCIDWLAHHQSIGNVVLVWQCSSLFYLMVDCRQTIEKVRTKRSFFLSRLQRTLYVLYMLDLKANIWTMCDMHVVSKWWCGTRISTFPFRPPNSYRKKETYRVITHSTELRMATLARFSFLHPSPTNMFLFSSQRGNASCFVTLVVKFVASKRGEKKNNIRYCSACVSKYTLWYCRPTNPPTHPSILFFSLACDFPQQQNNWKLKRN